MTDDTRTGTVTGAPLVRARGTVAHIFSGGAKNRRITRNAVTPENRGNYMSLFSIRTSYWCYRFYHPTRNTRNRVKLSFYNARDPSTSTKTKNRSLPRGIYGIIPICTCRSEPIRRGSA